ncbi:NUDIX domain-containing protein [Uliginosibacterium sp. H3]|uniref:NUDIX domain-containing protein n=1 Tax=Uliginosibacterium silvisoli TaxID=3114758 RepID=A0ABU6K2D7_9RHOO|nr:NUDIX domain-containing protein [Uliginosibacterium sp. H3]
MLDVVAWVCVRDRRMLAVRARGREVWYMPGGKREAGESEAQALLREVGEELGVTLRPDSLFPCCVVHDDAYGLALPMRMACFFADGVGEPAPQAEIDALGWLTSDDADQCATAPGEGARALSTSASSQRGFAELGSPKM